ncbi:unnamed protein product, partial [Rotaria sp. Silwood1]
KTSSNITTRSTSSSAPIKTPKPITSIGTTTTTWVNSNRSNRAISSSSTNNSTTINLPNWTHPKTSSSHNKTSHSNHYPYTNLINHHRNYLNNPQPISSDINLTSPSKSNVSNSYQMPPTSSSSLLVAVPSSTAPPPPSTTTGEYNPFASNILTTSIVDVLTKTKEPTNQSGIINDESITKMNFANVAKMNVPNKQSHQESILI